jgi:NitT/TauT family transport system substrate-binding protein
MKLRMSLLRGVCQTPAYVAVGRGFFAKAGLDVAVHVAPSAWQVPHTLATGESHFAVIPWTRVATSVFTDSPLVAVAGSGIEEAAIVLRHGIEPGDVKSVAVPREGGMKDLTAMGLIESLGWQKARLIRQPSGDGAIISLFGRGADAASMVEPYATMMEVLGVGRVIRRTGDIWPGAPGCSLCTSAIFRDEHLEIVQRVVEAYVQATTFVYDHPDEAAALAHQYIGIDPAIIEKALQVNRPSVDAIRNTDAMEKILGLMQTLGYIRERPKNFIDLSFLDRALAAAQA